MKCLVPHSVFAEENMARVGKTMGASINEKGLSKKRNPLLAQLLHASFGLDHYPNYLHRWNLNDIESLEQTLEDQLEEVRAQKRAALARNSIFERIASVPCPLEMVPLDQMLSPEVIRSSVGPTHLPAGEVARSLTESGSTPLVRVDGPRLSVDLEWLDDGSGEERLHSLPILAPTFCELLLAETGRLHDALGAEAATGSHEAGRLVDRPLALNSTTGLAWISDLLLSLVVRPLSAVVHPNESHSVPLDWGHSFVVGYGKEPAPGLTRTALVKHTDDSEITLNLCLGQSFEGGEVLFGPQRGDEHLSEEGIAVKPEIGRGILHIGRHIHEVLPVTGGQRHSLILWARSLGGVRSEVCPCCWMNRRERGHGASCVCGPAWN